MLTSSQLFSASYVRGQSGLAYLLIHPALFSAAREPRWASTG